MKERKFTLAVDKVRESREQGTKGSKKTYSLVVLSDPFSDAGEGTKITITSHEPFDGFLPNHGVTVQIKNPQKNTRETPF